MKTNILTIFLAGILSIGIGLECFAGEAYLYVDRIPGEANEPKHKDWLLLKNYSWGGNMPTSGLVSSGSAPRAQLKEFSFQMDVDRSFPKLALAMAQGNAIAGVVLHELHPRTKVPYLELRFHNARVSSLSLEATQTIPSVTVGITYGKVEWIYTAVAPNGSVLGQTKGQWDLIKNAGR